MSETLRIIGIFIAALICLAWCEAVRREIGR